MDYKKQYVDLIKVIREHRKAQGKPLRYADMAKLLGYNPNYFSSLRGKGGIVKQQHIEDLQYRFPEISENLIFNQKFDDNPALYKKNIPKQDRKIQPETADIEEIHKKLIFLQAQNTVLTLAVADLSSKVDGKHIVTAKTELDEAADKEFRQQLSNQTGNRH